MQNYPCEVVKCCTTNYLSSVIYRFITIFVNFLQVLDMCAAPGSKTAQLIEFLHAEDTPTSSIPSRHYIIPYDPGIIVLPALGLAIL